jgi:hypothetical protein
MWIKRAEYNETLFAYGELVESLNQEIRELKEKIPKPPRRQQLSEYTYTQLVKIAEKEYGIRPSNYEDKADLIEEILCVEKRLGVKESK